MKLIFGTVALTLGASLAATSWAAPTLKTEKDKVSYLIGRDIGENMKKRGMDLDSDKLSEGLKEALAGKKGVIAEAEGRKILENFAKKTREEQEKKSKAEAATNLKEGEAFLAKNKKVKGVKTTKSGLQYTTVKEGKGVAPKSTDTVEVHYKGTLINGKEFDSSHKRGKPATFPLDGVIKGWTEGIQLMKPGGKTKFFIPANLAYGERAMGGDIPPNSTLIFEVDLLSVKKKEEKKSAAKPKTDAKSTK